MSLKILDDDIKNKKLHQLYLFYGDDIFELEKYIDKIKKVYSNLELGVNFFVLDKNGVSNVAELCDSVSFFGDEKLILVKDTKLKFDIAQLEKVNNQNATVVIIEPNVDKRLSEYKKLQKMAVCVEFTMLNEKDASLYIRRILAGYKLNIDIDTAEYMVQVCTTDKQLLINEFKKLVAYLNAGDTVTREVIDKVCVRTLDAKIFDVIDNIVAKKKDVAFNELNDLLAQKTYIGVISSMIFKQIKQIYLIKIIENQKVPNGASVLGINPYVYSKLCKLKDKYTIEKLEELIYEFAQYDVNSKCGLDDIEIGLKRIIAIM